MFVPTKLRNTGGFGSSLVVAAGAVCGRTGVATWVFCWMRFFFDFCLCRAGFTDAVGVPVTLVDAGLVDVLICCVGGAADGLIIFRSLGATTTTVETITNAKTIAMPADDQPCSLNLFFSHSLWRSVFS